MTIAQGCPAEREATLGNQTKKYIPSPPQVEKRLTRHGMRNNKTFNDLFRLRGARFKNPCSSVKSMVYNSPPLFAYFATFAVRIPSPFPSRPPVKPFPHHITNREAINHD